MELDMPNLVVFPMNRSDSDLVIEAIIENLKIKQDLFEKLDRACKLSCTLVTNTSSLPVTSIGIRLSAERRKQ